MGKYAEQSTTKLLHPQTQQRAPWRSGCKKTFLIGNANKPTFEMLKLLISVIILRCVNNFDDGQTA